MTEQAFITMSAERYDNGAYLARRDLEQMEVIATKIDAFVRDMEVEFNRLDVARDMQTTPERIARSRFDLGIVAQLVTEALGEELLGADAAAALGGLIKEEVK